MYYSPKQANLFVSRASWNYCLSLSFDAEVNEKQFKIECLKNCICNSYKTCIDLRWKHFIHMSYSHKNWANLNKDPCGESNICCSESKWPSDDCSDGYLYRKASDDMDNGFEQYKKLFSSSNPGSYCSGSLSKGGTWTTPLFLKIKQNWWFYWN